MCAEAQAGNHDTLWMLGGELATAGVLSRGGRFAEMAALLDRALARLPDPQMAPDPWASGRALMIEALEALGEWDRAQTIVGQVAGVAYDSHITAFRIAVSAGRIDCFRGDVPAAEAAETRARSLLPGVDGNDANLGSKVAVLGLDCEIAAAKGDFAAVRRAVIDLLHTAGSRTLTDVWTPLMTAARVEADRTERADAGTDTATAEALQALRSMADDLPRNNDYNQARHLQVLADLSRAEGKDTVDTWRAVVHAWRPIGSVTTLAGPNFTWPGPLSVPASVVMPSIRWLTRPRSRAPWERDVCETPSWTWHAGHGSRSTWETAAGPGLLAWRG